MICNFCVSFQLEKRKLYFDKLKNIYKNILDDASAPYYISMHEEFVQLVKSSGIPLAWVYELVKEPFRLKPIEEFLRENSQKIINEIFTIDE